MNNIDANMVTGSTPDDELIRKILIKLGVDPGDWAISLSGIYAAIRSNMQIGEPHMSRVEDWTDTNELDEDTLTAVMFRLVERANLMSKDLVALHNAAHLHFDKRGLIVGPRIRADGTRDWFVTSDVLDPNAFTYFNEPRAAYEYAFSLCETKGSE